MTQARGPILNPGIYWIDSHPEKFSFTAWLNRQRGLAKAIGTRSHLDENPPREWILFQVLHPATWTQSDAELMGFPTVAPHGAATTEEDSRDAGSDASPGGGLASVLNQLFSGDGSLTGVALVVAGAWALGLFDRRR